MYERGYMRLFLNVSNSYQEMRKYDVNLLLSKSKSNVMCIV